MTSESLERFISRNKLKYVGPIISFVFGFLVLGILVYVGSALPNPPLNFLAMTTGGLIGWIAGLLMTPVLRGEAERFPEYGKALSTFVSGYLLSKLDRLFDGSNLGDMFVPRIMMFASLFALGLLATYVWRAYISGVFDRYPERL